MCVYVWSEKEKKTYGSFDNKKKAKLPLQTSSTGFCCIDFFAPTVTMFFVVQLFTRFNIFSLLFSLCVVRGKKKHQMLP